MFDIEFDEIYCDDSDEINYDDSYEIGQCVVCLKKFPLNKLNNRGECKEHNGETLYSVEAKEDWASFIENINKY